MSRRYLAVFVLLALGLVLGVSPAIGASADRPPDNGNWYNHSLTITFVGPGAGFTCDPVTYNDPDDLSASVSSTCTNGVDPPVASESFNFQYDETPPGNPTNPSPNPGPNANGWNNANVTVTWSCPDNLSGAAPVSDPVTGEGSGLQASAPQCQDNAGNSSSGGATFAVNIDRTAPGIGAGTGAPAANGTGWRNSAVTVTFGCTDVLSGPVSASVAVQVTTQGANQTSPAASCSDRAGNPSPPNTLGGISIDTTAPVLTLPTVAPVEATGPTGAVANIVPAPSATDNLAGGTGPGPITVMCSRSLTTAFPLGTTAVNCSAADGHGLSTARPFNVVVRDTTPPTLPDNIPNRIEIYENASGGASRSHPTIAQLLSVTATDVVDQTVAVTNNAPAVFPLEENTAFTITATDDSGNVATRAVTVFVRRIPPGANPNAAQFRPPSLDLGAPRNPRQLRVTAGDHTVTLNWQASTSADLSAYVVTREIVPKTARTPQGAPTVVYRGPNTSYKDKKLKNGVQYRYLVAAEDTAGNRSAGVAVVVVPSPIRLVAPRDGALIKTRKVKFRWAPVPKAGYYNLQLFRVTGTKEVKILSIWPAKASFTLNKSWKFNGRTQTLFADDYRWYIFPGFGKRSEVRYGAALGSNRFEIPKAKKAATGTAAATSRRKP